MLWPPGDTTRTNKVKIKRIYIFKNNSKWEVLEFVWYSLLSRLPICYHSHWLDWLCVMVWYLLQFIFTLSLWLKILSNIGEGSHEFANFMPIFCTGQWTLCYGGWQSLKLVQITRLRLQCICQFAFKLNFNFSLWQSVDLKTGHCRVLFCQKLGCSDITMNNTANIDSK